MRIERIRAFCEVVDSGFSISRAATALEASQPHVSKQIQMLEHEIGADLLVRRGGRVVGLTPPGIQALTVARRILRDAQTIKSIGEDHSAGDRGTLVIATTHFMARYMLAESIERFHAMFPQVHVVLRETTQRDALDMLQSAHADVGVLSQPPHGEVMVAQLQSRHRIEMSLVAAPGHPLLAVDRLSLEAIAQHAMVRLDPALSGGWNVKQAFEAAGLVPPVSLTASNLEIVKTYVARGLGVSILPAASIDAIRDPGLVERPVSHLIRTSSPFIAVHPGTSLRHFSYAFIRLWMPEWTEARVNRVLRRSTTVPRRR